MCASSAPYIDALVICVCMGNFIRIGRWDERKNDASVLLLLFYFVVCNDALQ